MTALELLRRECPTLSVGVLTADWMALEESLSALEGTGVRMLHFDVMDGGFAPLLTFGPPLVQAVRTTLLKDVHLMVEEPLESVEQYVRAGADVVTVHVEASRHPQEVLRRLGTLENANDPARGIVRGVALNPGTPVSAVEPLLDDVDLISLLAVNPGFSGQSFLSSTFRRLEEARHRVERCGRPVLLCVDGGVKKSNFAAIARARPDLVVTGSAVFDGKSPRENARELLQMLRGTIGAP